MGNRFLDLKKSVCYLRNAMGIQPIVGVLFQPSGRRAEDAQQIPLPIVAFPPCFQNIRLTVMNTLIVHRWDEIRDEAARMVEMYRLPDDPGRILPDQGVGSEQH